jgi:hypothetical protein
MIAVMSVVSGVALLAYGSLCGGRGREKRSTFMEHLIRLGLRSYKTENKSALLRCPDCDENITYTDASPNFDESSKKERRESLFDAYPFRDFYYEEDHECHYYESYQCCCEVSYAKYLVVNRNRIVCKVSQTWNGKTDDGHDKVCD